MNSDIFEESVRSEFDVLLDKFKFRYSSTESNESFDNCEILYVSGDYNLSIARERGSLRMYFGTFSSEKQWLIEILVKFWLQGSGNRDGSNTGSLLIASPEFHEFHEEYVRYKQILHLYLEQIIGMFRSGNTDLCERLEEFCAEYYQANLDRLARE
jgi:hypothetical protein